MLKGVKQENIDITDYYYKTLNVSNYDYHTNKYNIFYYIINHTDKIKYIYKFNIKTFIFIPNKELSKNLNKNLNKELSKELSKESSKESSKENKIGTHIYMGYALVLKDLPNIYFNSVYDLIQHKLLINHKPIYDYLFNAQWFNLSIIDQIIQI